MKSKPLLNLLRTACTPRPGTEEGDRASPSPDKSGPIRPHSAAAVPTQSAADTGRPSTEEGSELIRPGQAEPGSPSCCLLRLVFTLLFLFSRDKGERQRRRFSVVCRLDLRLWLGLVDILKYFLGAPSPELPLRINIFSKMKTVVRTDEGQRGRGGPGLSRQDGVIHLLHGVCLAGQLLQRPPAAFIQRLQAGRIQDLGE